ncbi:MAG TPA: HEAT repeat domain-containing protein [Kofleriaceae bacterium]|nr:HEAT repeat domain-containing protein [Kofleriaceae bacterium]
MVPSVRAQPADWGVKRDPFNQTDIARYKAILRGNPHDASALAKLLEMYRRYRTIDLLKDEYARALDKAPEDVSALIVMGRLQHATGDDARALELFQRAVAHKDADAATWLLIGELQKGASKTKEARAAYDKALGHASARDMKKKALRALADLALATGDNDGANSYFKQFLELDPTNAQLWIERGDAMLAAGKRDLALESYTAAEKLLGADPAKRVEVVARRGQALEGMARDDDAVVEYRRAIKLAPKGYYLEVELTGRIIDIYRRKQALPALLALYEKEWPEGARGHFEWDTLGKLYEETGAQDKAITALKRAVGKAPWELETQRRLIQLLENSGRDDEALAAYEAVVRAAPGEARFQLDLAERYWRRNQEKRALEALGRLEARFPQDAGVLSAIADMYTRWGKDDLAIAEYERLAKLEPDDPVHLVTLGEQYWTKGDRNRALATWRRLVAGGKASGFAKLGEVLAEHNQPEARGNFDRAIMLDARNPEHYKARAAFLETQKQYGDALADWEKVLELVGTKVTDRLARRDARRHYVTVVTKIGGAREGAKRTEWETKARGGDLEAGYMLVDYYTKRPQRDQPLRALEDLHRRVPDDQDLVLDLVKAYKDQRKFQLAVDTLQELLKIAPSREREIYSLISGIKTEERKDGEAEEWMKKALAKSPNDPAAYEHLAENYLAMQRFADAIAAYEKTISLDAHNSKAQFALAQLYVHGGEPMKAAELFRKVLRTSNEEETIGRAGRLAIDLEEMTDTLGELEKVISPLSFMMAHKPVYRRVLVDLYLRYVPRLVEREKHGPDEVKKAAHAELARISGHGLQPLLEALRDEKEQVQQRLVVSVLGDLGNKGAAEPLVHMARAEPQKDARRLGTLQDGYGREVRVEALVAAGRLGNPAVLAEVLPLMDHQELAMREAATFTLGRSGDRRAVQPLIKALDDRRPSVQVLACLGLAQADDGRTGPALVKVVADARRHDGARAACAYAIGARRIASGVPALLTAITDNRGEAQRLAAWALGQIGDTRSLGPLLRAYFARAGRADNELVWAIGRTSGAGVAPAQLSGVGEFPVRSGKYNLDDAIALVPGSLPRPVASARLIVDHAEDIARGLGDALSEHRDVILAVLEDLDGAPAQLSLGALAPVTTADPKLEAALATIAQAIEPRVSAQLTSEDSKVRALAVSVLAKLDGGKLHGTDAAITRALTDPAAQVRGAAMNAVAVVAARRGGAPTELVAALVKALASPAWGDRQVAALALGKLGEKGDLGALIKAAGDTSSFVREAVALSLVNTASALEPLLVLSRDDVPQVRAAAARSLGSLKDPRAHKRRAELASDPDPVVQEAARGSGGS